MLRYTTKAENQILRSLYAFPYLTVKELTRLLDYSPHSLRSRVSPLMTQLARPIKEGGKELVLRAPLYTQDYKREFEYWLSDLGRNELRRQQYDFTGWKEPKKMGTFLRSYHFEHYRETVNFLIESTLLYTINPNLQTPALLHDFTIKRTRRASIEMDGWFKVLYSNSEKYKYFCVEVDRKTEDEDFSDKIGMYLYFLDAEYKNIYHAGEEITPVVLVFTSMGKNRADVLLQRIEQKLRTSYKENMANLFRVAHTNSEPFSVEMFFQQRWVIPNLNSERKQVVGIFGLGG